MTKTFGHFNIVRHYLTRVRAVHTTRRVRKIIAMLRTISRQIYENLNMIDFQSGHRNIRRKTPSK